MWMSRKKERRERLSWEVLGILGATAAIAIFFFGFLYYTAISVATTYYEEKGIYLTEMQTLTINGWIRSLSLCAAVIFFVVLFLFLMAQKLMYLREIIHGVEALRTHRMDFVIPLEGNNELAELAQSINFLAETERMIKTREREMQKEREGLIRTLSHDIRTPLTAILSYTEYMKQKGQPEPEEVYEYVGLMGRKAQQIKELTNRLLDTGRRSSERIDNGKLLMEQLAAEWEDGLEEEFDCAVHLEHCPAFSGAFDVQELRRIFDNLASNVEKYADPRGKVELWVSEQGEGLVIRQRNRRKAEKAKVESHKLGLESIRRIARSHGGDVETESDESMFEIRILLSGML